MVKPKANRYRGPLKEAKIATVSPDTVRLFEMVAMDAIQAGDRKTFDGLNEYEKRMVVEWMSDALVDGEAQNAVHNVLWELDYVRKPVQMEKFLTDKEYLGRTCGELDDVLIQDLVNIGAWDSGISEVIFTGSLGYGKTVSAMALMAYKVYMMSCLRNPAVYYGLLPESKIVFGVYSITKRQTADAGYGKIQGYIDNSPYFRDRYPRNHRIDSKIEFVKHNIEIISGSQEMHAIGLDVMAVTLDEANFMRVKKDKEMGIMIGQAYTLYEATNTRIMTRFMRKGGAVPGVTIIMSSRKSETDFVERRIAAATGGKTYGVHGKVGNHTYVVDYPLWAIRRHRFSKQRFTVAVGDRISKSRILPDGEKIQPGVRTVDVPIDFRQKFEEDVDQSLRDLAGVATFNISPLIRDRMSVQDAMSPAMVHPFGRDTVVIAEDDDYRIEDYFRAEKAWVVQDSKWIPRINPKAPRFVHIDLSLSGDAAGFCMGHPSGVKRVRAMRPDGTFSEEVRPTVIIDMMLQIRPPANSETDLSKIRSFVLYLKQVYPIVRVSLDGFQSADSAQLLRKPPHRIEAGVLSVDRTDEPYVTLRSTLFDRRLFYYEYPIVVEELLSLQRDIFTKKVDHPEKMPDGSKGRKDVADALCGVVWACMTDDRAFQYAQTVVMDDIQKDRSDTVSRRTIELERRKNVTTRELKPAVGENPPAAPINPVSQGGNPKKVRVSSDRSVDWAKLNENV